MADKTYLRECCTQENTKYDGLLYTCYSLPERDGTEVRKNALPLPAEKEQSLIQANPILKKKSQLTNYYQYTAIGINRNYTVAKYLEKKEVRSTVRYLEASHENVEDTSVVYLETEKLMPLYRVGLTPNITIGFIVDMARRLFAICRDMDAVGVTHRNITPYCIFLNSKNRIQLGGFDCAVNRNADDAPLINPIVYTCHVAPDVKNGEPGSLVSDMYSITSIMACYLSGQNICETFSGESPALLPEVFRETIALGLSMKASNLKPFRDKLNQI